MPESKRGLVAFFSVLGLLAALRVAMSFLLVPEALRLPVSLLVTVSFIALPVLALFQAARYPWTPKFALLFIVLGIAIQFGLPLLVAGQKGGFALFIDAISQQGLAMWTVGLGALLATMLKDKNLLLPVSIFLALFDIFLVFTPVGFVQVLMKKAPNLLPAIAHKIPEVVSTPHEAGVPVGTFAHIGPADFVFMAMFFVALFRFDMRTKETFKWLLVALAVYIPLAMFVGAVPLLVPIGLAVLLVNLKEFKMTQEEKVSTIAVAVIGIAVVAYAATRPKPAAQVIEEPPAQSAPASAPRQPAKP